jgi:hypothetical protein
MIVRARSVFACHPKKAKNQQLAGFSNHHSATANAEGCRVLSQETRKLLIFVHTVHATIFRFISLVFLNFPLFKSLVGPLPHFSADF